MKDNNYVVLVGGEFDQNYIFKDIEKLPNVKMILKTKCFNSRLANKAFSILFSQKLNQKYQPAIKSLFFRQFFDKCSFNDEKQLVIIFIQGWYDKKLVRWLNKNHPEVIKVFYCDDTLGFYAKHIPSMNIDTLGQEFEFVLCYNPGDVEKYGYTYTNAYFSKTPEAQIPYKGKFDISFVGHAKDRLHLIERVYQKLSTKFNLGFYIAGVNQKDRKDLGIHYLEKNMSYSDYLGIEIGSDCILELVKGDTDGCTFRAWEAVYYNKKLLTNWEGIKKFKYYDPRFMCYFSDPDHIDMAFLESDIEVDYGYANDNSPIHLLEKIDQLITERENKS